MWAKGCWCNCLFGNDIFDIYLILFCDMENDNNIVVETVFLRELWEMAIFQMEESEYIN